MGLCFGECCCPIYVDPHDRYGHPIVGAQVSVYWNAATQGAFADPALNDTSVGPYTFTGTELKIAVDESNGIYLVKIEATGYATQLIYTFGCGKHCTDAFPRIIGPTSPRTITTNVQTTPFTYGVYNEDIRGEVATSPGWGLPVSGTLSGPPSPGGSTPATVAGGTFTLQTPGTIPHGDVNTCVASTGNPGVIGLNCSDSFPVTSSVVDFYTLFIYCPPRTVLFTTDPTSFDAPPPTLTVAGYSASGLFNLIDLANTAGIGAARLGSKVTNIQFSPFKVEGTWDSAYATAAAAYWGWLTTTFVGDPPVPVYHTNTASRPYATPDPAYIPLTGDWSIE